jgi:hypothetical protein
MLDILGLAGKVGGLGGVAIALLFFIFKQIVTRNIFPKLTQKYGAAVLLAIIDRFYKVALAGLLLGFLAYAIPLFVPGQNPPHVEPSVTVSIPPGTSLKNAILLLVDNDRSTANFRPGCPDAFLSLKVRGGTITAGNTADLIRQLNYRLIGPRGSLTIQATRDREGGIYEINCIP